MSGLAGIVRWDGKPISTEAISKMAELMVHRGPDGLAWEVRGSCALCQARLNLRKSEVEPPQVLWHPDGQFGITGDVRLFNSNALLEEIGNVGWLGDCPADIAIVLAGWLQWGKLLLDRLDGDFAFAIYDSLKHSVFAARDPFAIKPFFYHYNEDLFIFASEPKQIFTHAEVSTDLDDMIIGEFLLQSFQDHRHTFYSGIKRLRPAYYLEADATEVRETRYWNPAPVLDAAYNTPEKILSRFHELLRQSVRKRLETDWPVVSQLSGGYDSSSIVVIAGEIYRECKDELPPFVTVSAIFPGLECDESEFIAAVAQSVPFESVVFDPRSENPIAGLIKEIWQLDSPFTDIQRGLFNLTAKKAIELGGRSLLTGIGGDELVHEEYYLQDLAQRRRYWLLLQETWKASKLSWNSFATLLRHALSDKAPIVLKKLYRLFSRPANWKPPVWINPEFADFFSQCPEPPPPPEPGYASRTQDAVIQFMNFPSVCWALEALELKCAYNGITATHPFMDRPLVEFVASIPLEMRMPRGQWKYLLHKGLGELLPRAILGRKRKTRFSSFNTFVFSTWGKLLAELVFDGQEWKSQKYVNERNAKEWVSRVLETGVMDGRMANSAWRLISNEIWLRQWYKLTRE